MGWYTSGTRRGMCVTLSLEQGTSDVGVNNNHDQSFHTPKEGS
jgi:hypothetical protein